MAFYAYRKDNGEQVSFTHKIDWLTAVKSGNYSGQPLGTPAPAKKEVKVKGEVIQDVEEYKNVDVDIYTNDPEGEDKKPSASKRTSHNKKDS